MAGVLAVASVLAMQEVVKHENSCRKEAAVVVGDGNPQVEVEVEVEMELEVSAN